jgi:hypothetical protein
METVNLSFRYVEQDYVRALRAHYAERLRLPLDIAVIVGLAVLGVRETESGSRGFGISMLAVSGISAVMLLAAFAVIPKIVFRSQPKFRDDYSLTFSPQGGSTFGQRISIPISNGVCTPVHWWMSTPSSSTTVRGNSPLSPNAYCRTSRNVRFSSICWCRLCQRS